MRRFQTDGIEVLVPHLYGVSTKPPARKRWSEDEFFTVLEKVGPSVVSIVRDLYEWSRNTAHRIWFGTGAETGSFTFHYLKDSKTISVFTINTNGKLALNYGWLSKQIDQETMKEFHKRIHEIPTFRQIPSDFSKWPSVKILKVFRDPKNLEKFKKAVTWLNDAIKT